MNPPTAANSEVRAAKVSSLPAVSLTTTARTRPSPGQARLCWQWNTKALDDICPVAQSYGFSAMLKMPDLTAWRAVCP